MTQIILEPRLAPLPFMRVGAPLLALCLAMTAAAPLFWNLGLHPLSMLRMFFVAPLQSWNGVSEWLLKASPLVLIALGLTVSFRANVWNIGAEGMYTVGAICAAWLGLNCGDAAGGWLLPAMAVSGIAGGMVWAAIPALLKTKANSSEILVSLMLNYVAALILQYLVNGPMQDPDGLNYPQSASLPAAAMFTPLVAGMRINASVLITLVAAGSTWLFLERSFLGFQLSVAGTAPRAADYAGFDRARIIWLSLLLSGATAGLAGMMEVSGPLGQLSPVISPGYGFTAIIVAFVGRLSAVGVLFAGLAISLLYLGGEAAQISLNVPASLTRSLQGLVLFFLLAADVLVRFRVRILRL